MIDNDHAIIDSALASPSRSLSPVSGGDIHRSYMVELADGTRLFAKVNDVSASEVLRSEYDSLTHFARLRRGLYPTPINYKASLGGAVLLMSAHRMVRLDAASSAFLGRQLAAQHSVTNPHYGWPCDNYIGLTPQLNTDATCWTDFFREYRLAPQLKLAAAGGLDSSTVTQVEVLMANLGDVIDERSITPSLLHGDLWSGNAAFDRDAEHPILFDPAPYFGDAETDIAMTRLFSNFQPEFYCAYYEIIRRRLGSESRAKIYNLYHSLNHFNLFGKPYLRLIRGCVKSVIV